MLLLAFAPAAFAAPETTITGPTVTSNRTPTFDFGSDSPAATFECRIDPAVPFAACATPFTVATPLEDGTYAIEAQAIDATGTDPTPASHTFTVDTIAPDAPILTGTDPGAPANENNPKVQGTAGTETTGTVDIYVNDDTCTGTPVATGTVAEFTTTGIATPVPDDKVTNLAALVTDEAGNVSGCASPIAYTEDSTAPETAIRSGPSGTIKTSSATFTFDSNEQTASFECTLDGTAEACSSPVTYSGLAAGSHTFTVRATDHAGNVDATEAGATFTVDPSVPPPSAGAPPAPVGTSTVAARPAASFVLIAGRAIKVNRNRAVTVRLNCSGTKECSGRVVLTTASGVRLHRHRLVLRLGSSRFSMAAATTAKVKIRLSKSKYRLLKRLRRAKALVTVTDMDRAGRARIGTREITLRA